MIVWILGSMASGKTTQSRMLLKNLGEGEEKVVHTVYEDRNIIYTRKGNVAVIGQMKNGVATGGIDPVMSKLKVEGVVASIKEANKHCSLVVVEGAQAAATWLPAIKELDENFVLVHLELSFENNFRRLKQRQHKKDSKGLEDWRDVELIDNNFISIIGKSKQYRNLFHKIKGETVNSLQIDATKDEETIHKQILSLIYEN